MPTKIVIKKNTYFDSVSLMSVSTKANKLPGVEQALGVLHTARVCFHFGEGLSKPNSRSKP
ncbi:hypothetical protein ABKU23_19655 [Enterobacter hormaechei]|uniref:hypothetical protein n=1 Tax=Enterobacter cloacae complex TaxID=354276 RepID=UPI0006517755|nr:MULTISPECIES: hypothetical protein [Enterobacter cloacae complex]CAF9442221.1 hypothetical protein AI2904V1_3250 [Enterobacter cloacae]KLW83614.1 hypothetical protein SK62_00918 [Enterobacter sp. BIDMC109]KUQ90874.1 hypothetical protein AWI27_06780 [Enterobacter hormaechei subsp. steigerwaltii]MCY0770655.1 hypothetical protein [Enterobacter cloacae complex sp. 2022EL-00787]MDL5345690.1 hypothetical protein [Enterobacter hormaechei]